MKRKGRITKGEKMLYITGLLSFMFVVVLKVFLGAGVGNYKMSIEKIRYEISAESKKVESLTMQVNELTSFDNVKEVAKNLGLAYNNDNIIVVNTDDYIWNILCFYFGFISKVLLFSIIPKYLWN